MHFCEMARDNREQLSVKPKIDDRRILSQAELITPAKLLVEYPLTERATDTVDAARQASHRIFRGKDDRLLVICGPCSIHDVEAAEEYAERLSHLREELKDQLHIIMRVYFEKPRTTVGWKGLINDPDLDNSFNIDKGLHIARNLLLTLGNKGIPAATEFLDQISYILRADQIKKFCCGRYSLVTQCQ